MSATAAHAVVPTATAQLGLTGFSAFVVDDAHHHLLFGAGSGQNGVLVTDLKGTPVTTLATAAGIDDLSLSADGLYAYAASSDLAKIYQIDLASVTVAHTFTMPANTCPESVAVVSSTDVAFGYACDNQWGGVGVLNPVDGTVQTGTTTADYDPIVRAIPGTTQIVAVDHSLSEAVTAVLETATGTPVQLRDTSSQSYGLGDCEYLNDIAVSPDGANILTACGSPYLQKEYSLADFSPVASYVTNPYPTAVAYSPDGNLVAAGMDGVYDNDVALFNHNDATQVYALDYTNNQTAGATTPARGLQFSSDSSTLYAVSYDDTVAPPVVKLVTLPVAAIAPPASVPSTVTLSAPSISRVGKPITFSGRVTLADNAGQTNDVVAFSAVVDGVTSTGQATVNADGRYAFSLYASRVGEMTTTVTYQGDSSHLSSTASADTSVVKAAPRLGLTAKKLHGKTYVLTAHLTGGYWAHSVRILSGKHVVASGRVNAAGLLTVHYQRVAKVKLVAMYAGDHNNKPTHTSLTLP